jgi:hypothetical protein
MSNKESKDPNGENTNGGGHLGGTKFGQAPAAGLDEKTVGRPTIETRILTTNRDLRSRGKWAAPRANPVPRRRSPRNLRWDAGRIRSEPRLTAATMFPRPTVPRTESSYQRG